MKTEALTKFIDFVHNWFEMDSESKFRLVIFEKNTSLEYIEPLRRELSENLFMKSPQEQYSIFSYYIHEINKVTVFSQYFERPSKKVDGEKLLMKDIWKAERIVMKSEDHSIMVLYQIFKQLVFELYGTCVFFNLPYAGICKKVGFKTDDIFPNLEIIYNHIVKKTDSGAVSPQHKTTEIRPIVNPKFLTVVFNILKEYFQPENHDELFNLLQNGVDNNQPILFTDNGSRLADTLKQLFDSEIIRGCQKKELETWIAKNFLYRHRNQVKAFTLRYLHDVISSKKEKCQHPLLDVIKDSTTGDYKIVKV